MKKEGYSMQCSKRVESLKPSATLATAAKATALMNQGKDVLNLTLGQPDFHTPENIQEAAVSAIRDGSVSFYIPSVGVLALRQAIIERTAMDYGIHYDTDQVIVTDGAKFALYALFQTILNPGDEVIIPAPYWVSYSAQVQLAEGQSVIIQTALENQYKVTVDQLEKAWTNKTKALILNSPSNPSGVVYTEEELSALGNWAVQRQVIIVSDDIYGKLVYNQKKFTPIASISEEIRRQTIVINGVSKSYAMTGWRVGYALGNRDIIAGMNKVVSQSTSNCAAVSQYAAIEALSGSQQAVMDMRTSFEQRLNAIFPQIVNLPGICLDKPEGAFYLFPNIRQTLEMCGYKDVSSWVNDLLEEELVAVVSGEAFGAPDNIRLSYATDLETLEKAVVRMDRFIRRKIEQTN